MTVEDLPEANRVGDPPTDALVDELLDSGQIPHVNDLSVTRVNPFDEVIGAAGKAFNAVLRQATTHDQDDRPQIHEELTDGR